MASLARLPMLLLLGSFFLAMVSAGHPQQNKNPYLFRSQNFQTRFHNDQGRIEILPRFDLKHPHLRVLRNYRFVEFVLKPQSLFIPHHRDAETVLVSLEGMFQISLLIHDYGIFKYMTIKLINNYDYGYHYRKGHC